MKTHCKLLDDMGLVFIGNGAMGYGMEHGALRWAPDWVKRAICRVWNKVHCAYAGHDQFGYEAYTSHVIFGAPVCINCCSKLKIDGRHPTPEEITVHNELCRKNMEESEAKWRLEHPEDAAEHDRLMAEMDANIETWLAEADD
jgi:hypothetical protein